MEHHDNATSETHTDTHCGKQFPLKGNIHRDPFIYSLTLVNVPSHAFSAHTFLHRNNGWRISTKQFSDKMLETPGWNLYIQQLHWANSRRCPGSCLYWPSLSERKAASKWKMYCVQRSSTLRATTLVFHEFRPVPYVSTGNLDTLKILMYIASWWTMGTCELCWRCQSSCLQNLRHHPSNMHVRNKVGFQKSLQSFDAQERSHLWPFCPVFQPKISKISLIFSKNALLLRHECLLLRHECLATKAWMPCY